jgi:hypothetical protein
MKFARLLILPLLLAVLTLPLATNRAFADPRDFKLINNTYNTVFTAAYVSPSASNDWEDDILGQDVLAPGEFVNITFGRFNPNTCIYDIMVTGKDGSTGELDGINLCTTTTVTFHD